MKKGSSLIYPGRPERGDRVGIVNREDGAHKGVILTRSNVGRQGQSRFHDRNRDERPPPQKNKRGKKRSGKAGGF